MNIMEDLLKMSIFTEQIQHKYNTIYNMSKNEHHKELTSDVGTKVLALRKGKMRTIMETNGTN